jgi:hypothetical protein
LPDARWNSKRLIRWMQILEIHSENRRLSTIE